LYKFFSVISCIKYKFKGYKNSVYTIPKNVSFGVIS